MDRWAELRDGSVLLEDAAVLVVNKPAGISVVGGRHGVDLVTLARAAGEWLRPVHRIDKETSGAVLLAKEQPVHAELTRQFSRRSVGKAYLAITRSCGLPERGRIELPLSVGRKNRVRVAAPRGSITFDPARSCWSVPPAEMRAGTRSYPASTTFAKVWEDERHTLLAVQPATGRRHQIRVHLAWIGHPIAGDPLFDKERAAGTAEAAGARMGLHSWWLAFDAPWVDGDRVRVEALPGDDFWAPLRGRLPSGAPTTVLERARLGSSGHCPGAGQAMRPAGPP